MAGGLHFCESVVTYEGEGPWLPSNWKLRHKKIKGFVGLLKHSGLTVLGGERPFLLSLFFSHSVVSDSLPPHGLQHTMPACLSPFPRACSNSCPSSQWCHPTISSSVTPFSHLQSFPASGSFPTSQLFPSGGQNSCLAKETAVCP